MYNPTAHIEIGEFTFKGVVDVRIESAWDAFTDTCTIVVPRKIRWRGKNIALGESALIRVGDAVSVQLGYGENQTNLFTGYVSKIHVGVPVEIKCQDKMYLLKKKPVTVSFDSVSLQDLLTTILPSDVSFSAPVLELGPFRVSNATPVKVLDVLKKQYFLKSFFKDDTLYVGLAYVPELQKERIVQFNVDVHSGGSELIYQRAGDVSLKLKMISITDGIRIEYEVGDPEGEQRTMYYYDYSLSDMKAIANNEIERLRYEGYRGSVTVFGRDFAHGDIVDLRDDSYPEKDGRYLIRKVNTSFGISGFRQTLHLDSKL